MRRLRTLSLAGLSLLGAVVSTAVGAQACELPGGASQRIEGERYLLAWRSDPAVIAVGRHFAVEFLVCPKAGAPAPESVRVDAHMPEHRHGMNYQAQLKPAAGGAQRAEGMMFHMPGRWEFIFEVRAAGRTDRLTQRQTLK